MAKDGKAFKALAAKLKKKGAYNPSALTAYIGGESMGKATFQKKAAAGHKKK